jgi:hypothetical protein
LSIKDNVDELLRNIEETCLKCNREKKDIKLIAVTKTIEVNKIIEALSYGLTDFGENKVQELVGKHEQLPQNIKWHMIGHLQRNKVKYIVDKVNLIQSIDSIRLAEEINKECLKNNIVMDVLIEVNIGDEESKYGIKPENTLEFAEKISELSNIRIRGLMTVAPYFENSENVRPYMKKMNKLYEKLKEVDLKNHTIDILSMGMSNDYKIAIEEGSTMIRVGSLIFGERIY